VIRLLNHLRRAALQPESITGPAPTPASVQALTGDEPFLHDDVELAPVPGAEMDGLLQVDFDAFATGSETAEQASTRTAAARIAELESLLHASQLACADLRERFTRTSGMAGVDDEQPGALAGTSASSALRGSARLAPARDDDTHYFTSYAGHDIHQTMISDVSRTLSYARFLLHPRNAALIRGKVVMDVGCGSGILSLFAARAGAKKVIAIDASDVAHRAAANVKDNGMDGIVEVVKGKVEELDERLKEYHGKVDLLVSEWMVSVVEKRLCSSAHTHGRATSSCTSPCCRRCCTRATCTWRRRACSRRATAA
jgi:protein arginine N-methyltransferase 3